jgi:hypothetical protein
MVPALSIMFSVINELIANGTAIRRGSTLPAARAVADIQMPFVNEKAAHKGRPVSPLLDYLRVSVA